MPKANACRLCGRGFEPRAGGAARYCKPCRARAVREAARVRRAKCKECGRTFETASRVVRYCSGPCREEGYARVRMALRKNRRAPSPAARAVAQKCRVCGRALTPGGHGRFRVYCSAPCRAEGVRAKNREYMRRYLSDPKKRAVWAARASMPSSRGGAKRGKR